MAAADVSGKGGIPQPTYEPISAPGEYQATTTQFARCEYRADLASLAALSLVCPTIPSNHPLHVRCTHTGFDDPSIKPMEAAKAAHQWCSNFQAAIDKKDVDAIVEAFTEDGWWRDMLTFAFDFNSFKSELQYTSSRFAQVRPRSANAPSCV